METKKLNPNHPYAFPIGSKVRCKPGFCTDNTEENFAGHGYKEGKEFVVVGNDLIEVFLGFGADRQFIESYEIYYPENEAPIVGGALELVS